MRVIYNGVQLDLTKTEQFDAEPVYTDDGLDYLYTRYTAAFTAVVGQHLVQVSPEAIKPGDISGPTPTPAGPDSDADRSRNRVGVGYQFTASPAPVSYPEFNALPPGVGGDFPLPPDTSNALFGQTVPVGHQPGLPGVLPGNFGVHAPPVASRQLFRIVPADTTATVTHATIRHRLQTPRGDLWVFSGNGAIEEVLIALPDHACRMDPRGGPFPRLLGIDTAVGDGRMFVVHFGIEFYAIESEYNGVSPVTPAALLSNRFVQTHVIDPACYTTIHTAGQAIFRADWVLKNGTNPDAWRPTFFLPVPRGFVREGIAVEAIPGMMGVRYEWSDRQTPAYFAAGPYAKAASISIQHRQALTTDADVLEGALSVYDRYLSTRVNQKFSRDDEPRGRRRKRRLPPPSAGGP